MGFKFEFGRPRIKNISEDEILDELEEVAKHFNYSYFRRSDFNKIAEIHSATVERHFGGSWSAAVRALSKRLKRKNITLLLGRQRGNSDETMFNEMERIWRKLGHRPSRDEWRKMKPIISYDSIYRRFGGWTNACLKFIEYKSGSSVVSSHKVFGKVDTSKTRAISPKVNATEIEKTRSISLNIRLKVLNRDKFRCVFCGKSPATDIGTQLHIDHIVPFSKGGGNNLENLQTLCFECNLGKSNRDVAE